MTTFWTGNICAVPGTYESDCECGHVIVVRSGEDFPACAECLRMVSWELLAGADPEPLPGAVRRGL